MLPVLCIFASVALSSLGVATHPGTYNATLTKYVSGDTLWQSRGEWFPIAQWGARSLGCVSDPSSVACMACCMNRPPFAVEAGVAPIAVSNELWFNPQRGAVCSMCLKVYMPQGSSTTSPQCPDPNHPEYYSGCKGQGTAPYNTTVSLPSSYSAQIYYDAAKQLPYFIAIVIEWFDRNQTLPYALTYPTMNSSNFQYSAGNWPVLYEGIPCPVGNATLRFQFLDTSLPVPTTHLNANSSQYLESGTSPGLPPSVGESLCDNLAGKPCSTLQVVQQQPLGYIKFQVVGQRIPISFLQMRLSDDKWYDFKLSGDNYWQPIGGVPFTPDAKSPVSVLIYCSDGSPPLLEEDLVPQDMLCGYQDPTCETFLGTVQC